MELDMAGDGRWRSGVHFRRYLSARDGVDAITVIEVQDFDYADYDASRFLDERSFDTRDEALVAPFDVTDILVRIGGDRQAAAQALRLLRAVDRHRGL